MRKPSTGFRPVPPFTMASDERVETKISFEHGTSNHDRGLSTETSEMERRRLLRKIDTHILPYISVLYLLSFLDRSNIGNAKVAGMVRDAHLTGLKYNIVAAGFFITYALGDVPSNIILKLVRPSRWLPSLMVSWGIIMTLMSLCKTFEGLLIARVFLGLIESGVFPGVAYYLSLWFRRRDIALRIALFFSSVTVAGAFGGMLAYGIERMEGIGGLHGWQWIFCLEGLATIVVGSLSYFFIHDYPETATFLTEYEKQVVIQMIKEDGQGLATHYDMKFVWQALSDYKPYIQALIYMCFLITGYSIVLFLPSIIHSLGYSAANAQLLTIPPYVVACICTILTGYISDKLNLRGPFLIGGAIVALVGYIILITETRPGVAYVGTIIAAAGIFPTIAVNLAWAGSAAGGDVRRGVTFAMVIGLGNFGGVCSSFIYLKPPRFFVGHGTNIGLLTLSIFLSLFMMWDLRRLNQAKKAYCTTHGLDESRRGEFSELGSESPLFRFTL